MRFDLVLSPAKAIIPATEQDAERIARHVRAGELMPVRMRKPRNGGNHRRFWAMVRLIAENHERFTTEEHVVTELKIATGHYSEHISSEGEVVYIPKSIAYDELDEAEFREFFDKAVIVACSRMLPDFQPAAMVRYLDQITGF